MIESVPKYRINEKSFLSHSSHTYVKFMVNIYILLLIVDHSGSFILTSIIVLYVLS